MDRTATSVLSRAPAARIDRTEGSWLTQPFQIRPDPRAALLLTAVLWTFVFVLVVTLNILAGYVRSPGEYVQTVYGALTGMIVSALLYQGFVRVADRPAWLAFLAVILAVLAAGFVQMRLDYAGQHVIKPFDSRMVMPDETWPSQAKVALVYVAIYTTNVALFWVTFASRQVQVQRMLVAERAAAALQAELRVLRLQLNPHFMFNALSALSSLILAGRLAEANAMTQRLSDFLRAAIDVDAGADIRLSEELAVLDSYLAVETTRFGDKMRLNIEVGPEAEEAMVPNLLLQPLIENAIKYAVQPSTEPVTVRVAAWRTGDRLILEIVDQGAVVKSGARPPSGHGVGLEATRARLSMSYGADASLNAGPHEQGFRVRLELPYRSATV